MKKNLLLSIMAITCSGLFAGGIVTNTNQSASWARNPSTGASTGIEAVYYNPAGIIKLQDGWHFSLSNQYISQNREITNSYKGPGGLYGLNTPTFKGSVVAPLFPTVYAAFKKNKLAFSFAFNPIGGGGSAEFNKGLPSLETGVSDLVPGLAKYGVNQYRVSTYFNGSAINYGFQGGVTYQVHEKVSVFAGLRYVMVKNTYEGYLKGVDVYNYNNGATWTPASAIMNGIAKQAAGTPTSAATSTQALIDANAALGNATLAQAQAMGALTATQKAQLQAGLIGFGGDSTMTISQANTVFNTAAATYNAKAALLSDQSADVVQTGSGFCPILGVNLSIDKLNVGIKYEFATKIKIKNETTKDFTTGYNATTGAPITMFPNGAEIDADMPALLSVGASYQITEKIKAMAGGFMYFDKAVSYGKKINGAYVTNDKLIDNNLYEISCGIEYKVVEKLLLSAGFLMGKTGVKPEYNTDLSYSNSSNTIGLGGKYSINDKIDIDLGVAYAFYQDNSKTINYILNPTTTIPATETYYKDALIIGLGVNIKLSK